MSHGALDLGQHDHVELVADRRRRSRSMSSSTQGELSALMRVHRPVAPKSCAFAISMKPARAASLASAGIASSRLPSTTSTWRDQLRHLGAHLLDMRRHEMDHALEPDRQLAQRRGRADRQRLEEIARKLHAGSLSSRSLVKLSGTPERRQADFSSMRPGIDRFIYSIATLAPAPVSFAGRPPFTRSSRQRGAAMPQPLSGLLVLDFTTLLPGPLATLMLAEAGAEVIKIEKPDGEEMRRYGPRHDGESALFALLNRGKKSLMLDLRSGEATCAALAAAGACRYSGRAIPPGRDGPARPRIRRGAANQSAYRLLLDQRLRPVRPARRRGRARSQLHRKYRPAGAQSGSRARRCRPRSSPISAAGRSRRC